MHPRLATFALLLLIAPAASPADEPKKISGRVADQAGRAVPGASVAAVWGANGLNWDQVVALGSKEPQTLWQNEGKMEPWGEFRVVTDADGRFSIPAPEGMKTLMIYDRERRHGAVVLLDAKRLEVPVEVRLAPLVRISGTNRLSGSEGPLKWTCTYLNLQYDENDPLNHRRMAICGSYKARFEFLVPPGVYELRASSEDPPSATLENRKVSITADRNEVDLGGLVLRPRDGGGVQDLIDRAKARGTWGDYKQNFGKQPPPWHLTDAKGVAKDAKLSDFKGKWAVLYFWGPDCVPCLGKGLPELMAFYEAHKAQRDRFEILAFCCDFSETLPDIAALERQLSHVKKAVWGGKDLPFPVLLDNTFQTYERFGLEGNGVSATLLIDPEGKLVEGDLKALEKKLDHLDKNSR
jgi:peroxiredoxin